MDVPLGSQSDAILRSHIAGCCSGTILGAILKAILGAMLLGHIPVIIIAIMAPKGKFLNIAPNIAPLQRPAMWLSNVPSKIASQWDTDGTSHWDVSRIYPPMGRLKDIPLENPYHTSWLGWYRPPPPHPIPWYGMIWGVLGWDIPSLSDHYSLFDVD